jgi:hypothetical protein
VIDEHPSHEDTASLKEVGDRIAEIDGMEATTTMDDHERAWLTARFNRFTEERELRMLALAEDYKVKKKKRAVAKKKDKKKKKKQVVDALKWRHLQEENAEIKKRNEERTKRRKRQDRTSSEKEEKRSAKKKKKGRSKKGEGKEEEEKEQSDDEVSNDELELLESDFEPTEEQVSEFIVEEDDDAKVRREKTKKFDLLHNSHITALVKDAVRGGRPESKKSRSATWKGDPDERKAIMEDFAKVKKRSRVETLTLLRKRRVLGTALTKAERLMYAGFEQEFVKYQEKNRQPVYANVDEYIDAQLAKDDKKGKKGFSKGLRRIQSDRSTPPTHAPPHPTPFYRKCDAPATHTGGFRFPINAFVSDEDAEDDGSVRIRFVTLVEESPIAEIQCVFWIGYMGDKEIGREVNIFTHPPPPPHLTSNAFFV